MENKNQNNYRKIKVFYDAMDPRERYQVLEELVDSGKRDINNEFLIKGKVKLELDKKGGEK